MKQKLPESVRMLRRELLAGSAMLLFTVATAKATMISGRLPWTPNAANPRSPVGLGPWEFFSGDEGRAMEALADCIIPPDAETPGGKDSGCAVFIDRQLAGPYGRQEGLYLRPPFLAGAKTQGLQSEMGPAQAYREGLAALDRACQQYRGGQRFIDLSENEKNALLNALEKGDFELKGLDGRAFFNQLVKDVQMGFFADPIYGGNRGMVAWKMIGYPGARYNYLDWVNRHNERFPLPPVGMTGSAQWRW